MRQFFMLIKAVPQPELAGLTALLHKVGNGLTWLADAIHALPYKAVAWCRLLPERIRVCRSQALVWLEKKGVAARVKVFAPLMLAGLILPFCVAEIDTNETIYILLDNAGPLAINGTPDFTLETSGLSINDDSSGRDAQLILDAGQQITVEYQDETLTAVTRRETVANLLRRLDVEHTAKEMVVVDITGEQPSISIQPDFAFERDVTLTTACSVERVPDPLMEKGKEALVSPGQSGTIVETYRDTYREGELILTQLVATTEQAPVNEVVKYGTRVQEVSRDDRIQSVHYNDDGSGYLLFQSGDTMTFCSRVTCNATAYSIGNWTASGLPTKVGHIAVDPTVFPYHTRFYIYTNDGYLVYGNAVAADCGTAIKGYKMDLWFETYDEACWFGRRDCTVFVLN